MTRPVVVLHHEDHDGNCAGWIVKFYYSLLEFDSEVTLFPVQYNRPIPTDAIALLDKEALLYIVDFSYSREILLDLQSKVKEIHVFDHHATARQQLEGLDFAVFSDQFAGAGLTWDVLFNQRWPEAHRRMHEVMGLNQTPYFVRLVDDYDLWKFELPESEAFHAHCSLHDTANPKFWDNFMVSTAYSMQDFIKKGFDYLEYEKTEIKQLTQSKSVLFTTYQQGDKQYPVAVYQTSHNLSKVGSALLKAHPEIDFTICWFIVAEEQKVVFSLRSNHDRLLDVGRDVALPMGGGGHKNAAGFNTSITEGLKIVEKLYRK